MKWTERLTRIGQGQAFLSNVKRSIRKKLPFKDALPRNGNDPSQGAPGNLSVLQSVRLGSLLRGKTALQVEWAVP